MTVSLRVFRTQPQAVHIRRATPQSACWDVSACLTNDYKITVKNSWNETHERTVQNNQITLFSQERALIPTGWIFDIPEGYSMRLHPRSGLAWKQGITLLNAEGVIDADYIQETFVLLWNTGDMACVINHGDRIAQLEIQPIIEIGCVEETNVPITQKTIRDGGFGHTGVKA